MNIKKWQEILAGWWGNQLVIFSSGMANRKMQKGRAIKAYYCLKVTRNTFDNHSIKIDKITHFVWNVVPTMIQLQLYLSIHLSSFGKYKVVIWLNFI